MSIVDKVTLKKNLKKKKVFCWGLGDKGQLGTNSTINKNTPNLVTPVDIFNQTAKFLGSGIGSSSSFLVTENNQLYAWGSNVDSSLGDSTTTNRLVQTQISGIGTTIKSIHSATGGSTTFAIDATGQVFAWGSNSNGFF